MKSLLKFQLNVTVVTTEISETQFQLLVNEFSMAIENHSFTHAQKQTSGTITASKNFPGSFLQEAKFSSTLASNLQFDKNNRQVYTKKVYTNSCILHER